MSHELLLTARQKNKITNAFANKMSTGIKLSKPYLSKIIKWGGFLGALFNKIALPMMKVAVPLAKIVWLH